MWRGVVRIPRDPRLPRGLPLRHETGDDRAAPYSGAGRNASDSPRSGRLSRPCLPENGGVGRDTKKAGQRPGPFERLGSRSALLADLGEFQLDRGLAAEDRHRHAQALVVVVDPLDHAVEALERTIVDLDALADLEVDERARRILGLLDAAEDRLDLGVAHRHRTPLRTEEPGDAVDRVHEVIALIGHLHVHEHGYTEISPPFMVYAECMEGVGQFPKFLDQAYAVQEGLDSETLGKRYLIPTAEAPVANLHRGEILDENELPKYYCAYSPCFRAEAGAAGVSTRGMIRVHQFDKVELIKFVKPEEGYDELEKMLADAEKALQLLGLHYRVLILSSGDMGFAAAKTYDIELWAPGQGSYLEVSSVSNTEDFQARRMKTRFKAEQGGNQLPHILNGSGVALARLFVALIETYQQADGSITIPEPLQPYLRADRIPG